MSTTATASKQAKKTDEELEFDKILKQEAPADFVNMGTADAALYRPEDCKLAPIQGWLVEARTIDGKGTLEDYMQLVIELTAPSIVLSDGQGSALRVAKPGEMLVVTVTHAIGVAARVAMHPTKQAEVWMKPIAKVAMKGRPGQTTWRWSGPKFNQKTRDKVNTSFQLPESSEQLPEFN